MNAILVCVDYSDVLALTLPYNRHHFDKVLIVTTVRDTATLQLAELHDAETYTTDVFYADGADFNKFAALEQGLDVLGREGWLCIMDADVLWPKGVVMHTCNDELSVWQNDVERVVRLLPGELSTPRRRICPTFSVPHEDKWHVFPLHKQEHEFAGYTQIFHASDPVLPSPPWHQTNWRHAGGADSFFQALWKDEDKVRPPFEVLHLGPTGTNWCGKGKEQKLQQYLRERRRTRSFRHEQL